MVNTFKKIDDITKRSIGIRVLYRYLICNVAYPTTRDKLIHFIKTALGNLLILRYQALVT